MRNMNFSIDLWQIRSSDYPADMRKLNLNNDLCQSSILATGGAGVRARRSHGALDEMGRSRRNRLLRSTLARP